MEKKNNDKYILVAILFVILVMIICVLTIMYFIHKIHLIMPNFIGTILGALLGFVIVDAVLLLIFFIVREITVIKIKKNTRQ